MVEAEKVCALIPARGGSKGIRRKNLQPLGGKPLLCWSIEAALSATLVDRVLVSTEDEEIAAVAATAGAEVVQRPEKLASDTAQNHDVMLHVLDELDRHGALPDIIVLLQPTSPFRTGTDIDRVVRSMQQDRTASCMTVCAVEYHPAKMVLIEDNRIQPFGTVEEMEARRQDLKPVFRQNGAVYAVRTADFRRKPSVFQQPCTAVVMSNEASIDIDRPEDLAMAEFQLNRIAESNKNE